MDRVLSSLIDELRERPEVLGVAIFGSAARGDTRPDSDIDLFVLVQEGSWRDVETRDGRNYELVYASATRSHQFAATRPDDYLNMWRDARILLDKTGDLEQLGREAREIRDRGKPAADERTVKHRRFDAEDGVRAVVALQASDPATAAYMAHRHAEGLGDLFFELRGQWTPPAKERLKKIRESARELGEAFDQFYLATEAAEKVSALRLIIDRLFTGSLSDPS